MPERHAASADREDSTARRERRARGERSTRADGPGREDRTVRSSARIPAAKAAQAGLQGIVDLTGRQPEGVTAVERTEDGWLVGVEVLEDQRVPSSADVLAIYEANVDDDGELTSYRRVRRYPRGRGDSGEGG
jgi:hypothetical protein